MHKRGSIQYPLFNGTFAMIKVASSIRGIAVGALLAGQFVHAGSASTKATETGARAEASAIGEPSDGSFAPDRIIVKFKAVGAPVVTTQLGPKTLTKGGPSEQVRQAVRRNVGATLIRKFRGDDRTELWRVPAGQSVPDRRSR